MPAIERISPFRFAPPWVRYQHLARYEWARSFARDAIVVDAACGTGYGSEILSEGGARFVHGFDVSCNAIDEAREKFSSEKVDFKQGDVADLPLPDHAVDLFVSFETIEHLADERGLLREATRVLKQGGIFLCSSPNRNITNPGTAITDKPFNTHHVREYAPGEFDVLLRKYFRDVSWYGQTFFSRPWQLALNAAASVHHGMAVKLHQFRKLSTWALEHRGRHVPRRIQGHNHPEFLVALCRRAVDSLP